MAQSAAVAGVKNGSSASARDQFIDLGSSTHASFPARLTPLMVLKKSDHEWDSLFLIQYLHFLRSCLEPFLSTQGL